MPVRMYSIISRACAYACAGTQARKAKKHSKRMSKITCLTTKNFMIMEDVKKTGYTNEPTVTNIKVNEMEHEDVFQIGNYEGKWFIAIAGKIVSRNKFDSAEQARAYINSKPWELIFNATAIMYENIQNYKLSNK